MVKLINAYQELLRQLKFVRRAYNDLGHLYKEALDFGLEARMIYYEDLSANTSSFAQLANWLQGGASKCPSATNAKVNGPGAHTVRKIHSKRLRDTVANWDSVVRRLNGTVFEEFLAEECDGGTVPQSSDVADTRWCRFCARLYVNAHRERLENETDVAEEDPRERLTNETDAKYIGRPKGLLATSLGA